MEDERPNPLIRAAFGRAKVVMLALVVLALFGVTAFGTMPREADPDIPLPYVSVAIPLPGVSPEDAERLLVRPAEEELLGLEGLKELTATAYDGLAVVRLEFEFSATDDMPATLAEVRAAVDTAKADFPAEALEPIVEELNAQSLFPVISVVLSGEAPERTLRGLALDLEDRLLTLPGVLEVELSGARDELLEVAARPEDLAAYSVTPADVARALAANDTLVTAGTARFGDGDFAVKVAGLAETLDDVRAIPLRAGEDGVVTIGDVGTVRRTFEDPAGYARMDGRPAIGLNVTKRAGANMIEVTEAVKAETMAMAEGWPSTVVVQFTGDQSVLVDSIFASLTSSIGLAIILVMIVVVAALGFRSALMVGIAIPCSFLIGIALMGFMGYTLNMLVMFSMVLAVGMLVDGAIVIVELADRRMAEGASRREAYLHAAERMFWPITASTATTIAAFLPFLFWEAVDGEFMRWIPITLIFVLGASLFVALVFLPIIGATLGVPSWMRRRGVRGRTDQVARVEMGAMDPAALPGLTGAYARLIRATVQRPVLSIAAGAVVVWMCLDTFGRSGTEVEYFLRNDKEQVLVLVQARGNVSQDEALSVASEARARIADHPAIESVYTQTGPDVARVRGVPAETIARLDLDLLPYEDREHSLVVIEQLRGRLAGLPGVMVEVRQPDDGPEIGKDVQVELRGPDEASLREAAALVRGFLEGHANGASFTDVEDDGPLPGIEYRVEVDREEAGRFGVTVAEVGQAVQLVTDGVLVGKYRPADADEEVDVRLRYPAEARALSEIDRVQLPTPAGLVPLSNFVARVPAPKLDRVVRTNGQRVLTVQANGAGPVGQDEAIRLAEGWLASGALERAGLGDVRVALRGAAEDRDEAGAFFAVAMSAAMVMIGIILLLQFDSFYHAALTLSAVVLSVIGVLAGVAISGQYVSVIMTGVGIVALAGIVVNNNIVLIDTYQTLRRQGLAPETAVVRTAAQRLRPVLLTTVTTIIGLLPMVFQLDIDFARGVIGIGNATSDWWVLLSSAIVYGLAFSTLLTLVLTPVLLATPSVLSARLRAWTGRTRQRREMAPRPARAEAPTPYAVAAE